MRISSFWTAVSVYSLHLHVLVAARLTGIPTVPFESHANGSFALASVRSVVVDGKFAEARDERGQTLIPPTLKEFAATFAADLDSALGIRVNMTTAAESAQGCIFLTLGRAEDYVDAAGAPTSEGYSLSVSATGITITGASPLGAWWGTRTVLQQAVLSIGNDSSSSSSRGLPLRLPYGTTASDAPGWGVRGMMLDAGRHWYPAGFLADMCAYMSFFKQNTFHVHLSDNENVNTDTYTVAYSLRDVYARFRLWSDAPALAGLNRFRNESYTRAQFDGVQRACAARGVTVLPEIEAPGHALVVTQWKPELALAGGDPSLLNISHPDTIPTMRAVWAEFLPWFHAKTVSIGADEYTGGAADYNRFVNAMADFIWETAGKRTRIWGTFPPNATYGRGNVYRNVSMQHWEFYEDNPYFDYIQNGYDVLNSDDAYYVVSKWSDSYPQQVPVATTFLGNPAGRARVAAQGSLNGSFWYPYVFDTTNATNNPPTPADPRVLGAVTPLWNDWGANASTVSEAYYALRDGVPALADKQWGGDLAAHEFGAVLTALRPFAPGQNLERRVKSKTATIFNYTFAALDLGQKYAAGTRVPDTSGNGYHASTQCKLLHANDSDSSALAITPSCSLKTPLESKGRDYTLTLRLRLDNFTSPNGTDITLASGADSALLLTPNVTLVERATQNYYRLNATVPRGVWVDLSVFARGNRTFARLVEGDGSGVGVDAKSASGRTAWESEFLTVIGVLGEYHVWAPTALEAPVAEVGGGGWSGALGGVSLSSEG